jgi:hypothetical protein
MEQHAIERVGWKPLRDTRGVMTARLDVNIIF